MSLYKYRAISRDGELRTGTLEATNESDLEARLAKMKMELISSKQTKKQQLGFGTQKIEKRDLIVFCIHLGQLTTSGVPLLEGMSDLRDSMDHPRFKEVIANLIESIEGGKNLSDALEDHKNIFDSLFVNLIRAGEASGTLGEVFTSLAEMIKWQDELSASTKKLLMAPMVVGTVVIGVLFFLMIYLVPQLVEFIVNMGQELPTYTILLIATSDFIVEYWYLCLFLPIGLFFVTQALIKTSDSFRYFTDSMQLRIWRVGAVIQKITLSRFTNYFAMMYKAGVPILAILKISERIIENRVIRGAIVQAREDIEQGEPVSRSLEATTMFPPLVIRMIKIGETTGQLDKALLNVSYFYERDIKDSIDRLQALIQPMMTLILGSLLGWVMLAVLGPIYTSLSSMQI